jgi:hypothetical protein
MPGGETMTLYFANPCGSQAVAMMQAGDLGYIDTPHQNNIRPTGVTWCADNGCFSSRFEEGHWWSFLKRHAGDAGTCAFATAPDVVGDAAATLTRSGPWLQRIRALGYPVALVGQDGLEDLVVPWGDFDAFFIGGSTEWKLGPEAAQLAGEARERGKWVHMGRVNSRKRMRYAESIGCHSADGTYLTFGPTINLPKLARWFDPPLAVPA